MTFNAELKEKVKWLLLTSNILSPPPNSCIVSLAFTFTYNHDWLLKMFVDSVDPLILIAAYDLENIQMEQHNLW